ncbi:MAG: TcpQ domain-containing protein [Pseudomonadota bacterium]
MSNPVEAGFEFQPAPEQVQSPVRLEQAPTPPPAQFSTDPMPVTPVEMQPLSPAPKPIVPSQTPVSQPSSGLVINPYPDQATTRSDDASLLRQMLKESGSLNPLPQPSASMRVQAVPQSPIRKSNFAEIQGFGRDLPLVIALSQVVPANYTYSFESQGNAGKSVSWQGGRPWDQVLQSMLSPVGLNASIRGNFVYIQDGSMPQQAMPEMDMMPAPLPVAASQPQIQIELQEPVLAMPVPVQSNDAMVSRSSDLVSSHTKLDVSQRPRVPARISRMNAEKGLEISTQQSDLTEPPASVSPLPQVEQEIVTEAAQPMQIVPAEPDVLPAVEPDMPIATDEPVLMSTMPDAVESQQDWSQPSQLKMVSSPSMAGSLDGVRTWRAVRGDSLKTVLTDWAMDAGVELFWSSEFDYPLDSSVRMNGTFEEATQNILMGLRDARPRPIGRLHPNDPEGPAVLVIETQQIVE